MGFGQRDKFKRSKLIAIRVKEGRTPRWVVVDVHPRDGCVSGRVANRSDDMPAGYAPIADTRCSKANRGARPPEGQIYRRKQHRERDGQPQSVPDVVSTQIGRLLFFEGRRTEIVGRQASIVANWECQASPEMLMSRGGQDSSVRPDGPRPDCAPAQEIE
jgi:hypothetical protein